MFVMNLKFMTLQGGLLYLLLALAPQLVTMNLIWTCHGSPISYIVLLCWMASMMILAGVIRTFVESSFVLADEILHLSPLTSATSSGRCDYCSLTTTPPPARMYGPIAQARCYLRRNLGDFQCSLSTKLNVFEYLSDVFPLLKSLVIVQKSRHAMVVILRPAPDTGESPIQPRSLIFGVFCGFIQALMLIALTILFGSIYNNGIFQAASFVVVFIALIVISRTYSILYCLWMERAVNTTIIEYRTPTELRAIKAILAGMPLVLVDNITDGSQYGGGYRLGKNPDCTNHPLPTTGPCPRIFGRTLGLAVGLSFAAHLVPVCVWTILPVDPEWFVNNLIVFTCYLVACLFVSVCITSKIISEFDFIATHQSNMP